MCTFCINCKNMFFKEYIEDMEDGDKYASDNCLCGWAKPEIIYNLITGEIIKTIYHRCDEINNGECEYFEPKKSVLQLNVSYHVEQCLCNELPSVIMNKKDIIFYCPTCGRMTKYCGHNIFLALDVWNNQTKKWKEGKNQ